MFGNGKLEQTLADLKARVVALENECAAVRVGSYCSGGTKIDADGVLRWVDPRPKVSLHEVAVKLMEHCGLEFEIVPATDERILVRKKPDATFAFIQSGAGTTGTDTVASALKKHKRKKRAASQ